MQAERVVLDRVGHKREGHQVFQRRNDRLTCEPAGLLDASLEALSRDFVQMRSGWFSRFHEELKPSLDERAARVDRYLLLLGSTIAPTVSFAVKALQKLDRKGLVPAEALLDDALGDLAPHVDVTDLQVGVATEAPTDNDLWDTISKRTQIVYPDATLVPGLVVGGTDARFYRQRGRVAYGAGLFSPSMDFATFGNRFHGHAERIDVESLALATEFWIGISKDLVG